MNDRRTPPLHYTDPEMVRELLLITPIKINQSVLDAGSGKNKVWFNALDNKSKYECEIEDGVDFLGWDCPVDWIVGNPPFHIGWKFTEHASIIAREGIGFLGNINFLNQFTPKRLSFLVGRGFYINHIHVCQDKRWFGRYFYIILTKEKSSFISWQSGVKS